MPTGLSELNRALNLIPKRAEQRAVAHLRDTFVDSGVAATLAAVDHQLMYGRRGTGKTHALRYVEAEVGLRGDIGIYVDMRTIGSPDGLFLGETIPATERAARLLVDLLGELHEQLRQAAMRESDTETPLGTPLGDLLPRLDRLLEALTTVEVVGNVEVSHEGEHGSTARGGIQGNLTLGPAPSLGVRLSAEDETSTRRLHRETRTGTERLGLNFGDVARALRDITRALPGRLWLLLDEWSSIPLDVQPLLGEFLVRCVLPLSDVTVKIASLEQHTNFRAELPGGTVGLEVGADITANVDLDEFMVFDQSEERARAFFASLLFKHVALEGRFDLSGEADLIQQVFETPEAFDELVRASEGVPRDAINVVAKAAAQAGASQISVPLVRSAARTWYQSDKEAAFRSREDVRQLLSWIVDRVLRQQHYRGFLVNQRYANSPLLRILFDARVLHLIGRGYLGPQHSGERYDLWVVDYGAYVDLLGTGSEPERALPFDVVDGRADPTSLGRAVLDFEEYTQLPPLLESRPTLDQLLPALHTAEEFGLQAIWEGRGTLQTPVAIVDQPYFQRKEALWLDLSGAAGHVAICGGPQSGKSTFLRTLLTSLALTHTPAEVGFYCLDFGGGSLLQMRGLPHVANVATRRDEEAIRRTAFELMELLAERERLFAEHGIDSIGAYRRRRRQRRIASDGFPIDVFLVVDGWSSVQVDHEEVATAVAQLGARGLGFGIHVVASASNWSELQPSLRDLFQTRLELRLGDPDDSQIDRTKASYVPIGHPGTGLSWDGLHMVCALPRIDGVGDNTDIGAALGSLAAQMTAGWTGPQPPPVRLLPEHITLDAVRQMDDSAGNGIPFGIDEIHLRPVYLHPDEDPHLVVFGADECGKSDLLDVIVKGIVAHNSPADARILLVDYRRSLLDSVQTEHLIGYAASSEAAAALVRDTADALRNRLPGADVTPEQLRDRSWWSGPELYVIVDDYELVAASGSNPLMPLIDLVAQAGDLGLHLLLATGLQSVARAMFDPIIGRMRDMGSPMLFMSSPRDGEAVTRGGYRVRPLPPGRGMLVTRRRGERMIQAAYVSR